LALATRAYIQVGTNELRYVVEFEDGTVNHLPCGAIQMLDSNVIEEGNGQSENEEFELPSSSSSDSNSDTSDDEDIDYLMDHEGDVYDHRKLGRNHLRVLGLENRQGRRMSQARQRKQVGTTMGTNHAEVAQTAEFESSGSQPRSSSSTFFR
jgi:hypothetical protein